MAVDLDHRPDPGSDELNPGQENADREFAALTHPGRDGQSAVDPMDSRDLRDAEEGGGLYNPGGDNDKKSSAKNLAKSEGSGDTSKSSDSLYNPAGESGRKQRFKKAKSGLAKLRKNKLLFGLGLAGGLGPIAALVIIILLISPYKVADFAEHVAEYQFVRTTAQMAQDAQNINEEKVGLDSIPDTAAGNALYARLKSFYTTPQQKASDLWGKLEDKYSPNKIIQNFDDQGILQYNEATTKLGRTYISSVKVGDSVVPLESKSISGALKDNLIPGYKFVTKDVNFSRGAANDIVAALKANDIGPLTRARVAKQIRQELNVSLTGWVAGRFLGKTQAQADAEQLKQTAAAAEGEQLTLFDLPTGETPAEAAQEHPNAVGDPEDIGELSSAADDASENVQDSLFDAAQIEQLVEHPNETPPKVVTSIENSISDTALAGAQKGIAGALGDIVGIANPIYKYAIPLCLIYDGSIQRSGPEIDRSSDEAERLGIHALAEGDQAKDGSNVNAVAVGAGDWQAGDISSSNAEIRAGGGTVDTSNYQSTEASPTGQYTYTIADYLGGFGSLIDKFSPGFCAAATNLWVGAGVAVGNVTTQAVIAFITGGAGAPEEGAADAALETSVDEGVPSLASRIVTKVTSGANWIKDFGIDTTKQLTFIGASTLIAKQLVLSEVGQTHSITAVGKPLDDEVDDGVNKYANQIEQQQFYGAPMTDSELTSDTQANEQILASNLKQQSAFQRYLAVDNPDSLISHIGIESSGFLNDMSGSKLLQSLASMLNPLRAIASLSHSIFSGTAFAAAPITSVNTYYGNIQFGYTAAEKQLMRTPTYQPLENQSILDASGKEDAIDTMYHECFDGSMTIGTMLSTGLIKRDSTGNIISTGTMADINQCSPANLGPDNPEFGDLVFRYRVAHNYDNALDQLTDEQGTSQAS